MNVRYAKAHVQGLEIFYREAGDRNNPAIVLLHGFPSSSHMFRDLIPLLAHEYHVIAPDYPGFGFSSAPPVEEFTYTFDHLSDIIDQLLDTLDVSTYTLFMQDYGGPIGFRIAVRHPERVSGIVIQNTIAHMEGASVNMAPLVAYWQDPTAEREAVVRKAMLTADATKFQYMHGASDPARVSPDSYTLDQALLDRPGNDRIQLALLLDYRNNPSHFPAWQAYLRDHRPPMVIAWGQNDPFFTVAGAHALAAENPAARLTLYDGGHFALEEHAGAIAQQILSLKSSVAA